MQNPIQIPIISLAIVLCMVNLTSHKDAKPGSDVVCVRCFGVRVSVMFHFMFVHYTFSSVWVAEWPPFGK